MFVFKSNGLVPVRALKGAQFKEGTLFGLSPAAAIKGIQAGEVELRDPPEGAEGYEVPGPKQSPAPAASAPAKPTAPKQAKSAKGGATGGDVEIPANWDAPRNEGGLQWMQMVKLAESILGVDKLEPPEGTKPKEHATTVIREELARRAAAESEPSTGE